MYKSHTLYINKLMSLWSLHKAFMSDYYGGYCYN